MSVLLKIVHLVLNVLRVNGEINYLTLTVVVGFLPLLIWLVVKKLTLSKKGPNPFAQDTRRASEPLETDLKARDKVLKNGFVAKKVPENLDVIFIGSGIGSLSCAAMLAKTGKKILVLEQHDQAGGCCHTFHEKGFEFDTGIHYVGDMAGNSVTKFLVDQLRDGQLQWSPLDIMYDEVVIGSSPKDSKTFPVMSGKDVFKNALLEKFPNETKGIEKYFDLVQKSRRSILGAFLLKLMPRMLCQFLISTGTIHWLTDFFKYSQRTLAEVMTEITDNKDLRAVLSYCFGDYGTPPKDASFALHAMLANHFMKGSYYPVGGASEIAMKFIPVIEKTGGNVLVRAPVKQILVDEETRKVKGVRVAKSSGDVDIHAPLVVSGAGVYNTFDKLLPYSFVKEKESILSLVRHGVGGITVYVGLNVSNDDLGVAQGRNKWLFSNNELDQSFEKYISLPVEDVGERDIPLLFLSFPSTKDPTWQKRFPGKSTLEIVSLAAFEWFERWKGEKVMHRGEEYEAIKQRIGKRMWEQILRFYPSLKDKVEYFDVGSPLSNQYYIAASRGELYGADHNVERFSSKSVFNLRADTSIKGLFLTGQDIFTCGFSGGLYSGVISASTILRRNIMNDLMALRKQCEK